MSCEMYQRFELGDLEEARFDDHLRSCVTCQRLRDHDDRLLALARDVDKTIEAPGLWSRIENALQSEEYSDKWRSPRMKTGHGYSILKIAAVLVLTLGLGWSAYLLFSAKEDGPRILAARALQQVEKEEQEYLAAITELERVAQPQLTRMELALGLLYRDRLETIDAQIDQCREALATNPANAHIRRYLWAALQDKRQTLVEVSNYKAPGPQEIQ